MTEEPGVTHAGGGRPGRGPWSVCTLDSRGLTWDAKESTGQGPLVPFCRWYREAGRGEAADPEVSFPLGADDRAGKPQQGTMARGETQAGREDRPDSRQGPGEVGGGTMHHGGQVVCLLLPLSLQGLDGSSADTPPQ